MITLTELVAISHGPGDYPTPRGAALHCAPWTLPGRGTGATDGRLLVLVAEMLDAPVLLPEAQPLVTDLLDAPRTSLGQSSVEAMREFLGPPLTREICPACQGKMKHVCRQCKGSKEAPCTMCETLVECQHCDGAGVVGCEVCSATGLILPTDIEPVRIGRNVYNRHLLRRLPVSLAGPVDVFELVVVTSRMGSGLRLDGPGWVAVFMPLSQTDREFPTLTLGGQADAPPVP